MEERDELLQDPNKPRDTHRITFGNNAWVDVYEERIYGDNMTAQRLARERTDARRGNREQRRRGSPIQDLAVRFDAGEYNLAMVQVMIHAWSSKEEINADTVQRLPLDVVNEILDYIERNAEDEDELGKSEKNSTSQSEKAEGSIPSEMVPTGQAD